MLLILLLTFFSVSSFPPSTGPVNASHGSLSLFYPYSYAASWGTCYLEVSLSIYLVIYGTVVSLLIFFPKDVGIASGAFAGALLGGTTAV